MEGLSIQSRSTHAGESGKYCIVHSPHTFRSLFSLTTIYQAILHSEEGVKRSTLKLWRAQTRLRVQQCSHEVYTCKHVCGPYVVTYMYIHVHVYTGSYSVVEIVYVYVHVCMQHSAVAHHQRRLLSTALHKWKDRRQSRVRTLQHMVCATEHYTHRSVRRVWTAWMKVTCMCIVPIHELLVYLYTHVVCGETENETCKMYAQH